MKRYCQDQMQAIAARNSVGTAVFGGELVTTNGEYTVRRIGS
ncbi:MAG TPA: hypothetical protein VLF91_02720 [Candidatus Saccharimonadales bacterium]|nr:hypothetical protein [Candidatus Saccharimonadales bacterium]